MAVSTRNYSISHCDIPVITLFAAALAVFLVMLMAAGAMGGTLSSSNGSAVCTNEAAQDSPVICSDGSGGAFLVWEDERFSAMTGTDLYAQHISSSGAKFWAADVEVSRATADQTYPCITADGAGGFYCAWVDDRAQTAGDIYAVRINSDGNVHAGWSNWGTVVSEDATNYTNSDPCICALPSGGVIVAFKWYKGATGSDIYAQRMSGSGAGVWLANGVAVTNANLNQDSPAIAWSEGGTLSGPIIAWQDDNVDAGSNEDIYAMKLKPSDGSAANANWNVEPLASDADGNPVKDDSSGDDYTQQDQRIIADGSGGAIVTWETLGSPDAGVYAQKLDEDGFIQWAGDVVCDTTNDQLDPAIVTDGAGGAIIAWEDLRNDGGDIYVQNVSSGGTRLWNAPNGVAVSTFLNTQLDPAIVEDGSGGAFIAWEDNRGGGANIFAQWINTLGLPEYDTDGVGLAVAAFAQQTLAAASGRTGRALFCWEDTRTDPDADVYAQFLSGDAPDVTSITPSSGETGGTVSISNLAGTGFDTSGVSVVLRKSGEADIAATGEAVASSIRVTCDIDLAGAATGTWDVYLENNLDSQHDTLAGAFTVGYPAPTVAGVTPNSAANNGTVSITNLVGTGFQAGVAVKLARSGESDIAATGVSVVSSTRITCELNVNGVTPGTWDVVVSNSDGQSGTLAGGFTVNSSTVTYPTWYLAEGTSDWGFDTYITIENPNGTPVTASITYQTKAGTRGRADIQLPAVSQTVINPRNDIGVTDFSTKVVCKEGKTIAVDRRMIWTGGTVASGTGVGQEGHASVGVTAPAKTWYMPEGSSKWGFETWLLIQNPNGTEATCTVTYMIEGEQPRQFEKKIPAGSRATFNIADDIGAKDASIKVDSNLEVIPERAMYRNNRREGHCSIGTTTISNDYYLAEGTTAWGFTTYVLVQNPNNEENSVTITYMTPSGARRQAAFTMAANSRKTVRVNDTPDVSRTDLSTLVQGTRPVIAERAMYWNNGTGEACHDSIGMSVPHTTFYLPDGETSNGMETWTLVQNPNDSEIQVEVSYLTATGVGNVVFTETVSGNSRKTFNMADKLPGSRAAIMVTCKTSGKKIMVERAMYWNSRGAGTDTIGGYSD